MHETVKEDLLKEDSLLATSVWSAMLAGNRKFAEGSLNCHGLSEETRLSLIEGQHPGAVVLSCADSRVAPDFIFDAGFVVFFSVFTAGEFLVYLLIFSVE